MDMSVFDYQEGIKEICKSFDPHRDISGCRNCPLINLHCGEMVGSLTGQELSTIISIIRRFKQDLISCPHCNFDFAHNIHFDSLEDIVYCPKCGTKTIRNENKDGKF